MKQSLLPTSWQYMKVRQATIEDGQLRLVWTVDTGQHKWQNKVETYNLDSDFDMGRLYAMCATLNFEPYPIGHDEFTESFLGLRAKHKIDRKTKRNWQVNYIAETQLPDKPPEVDVTKEKTEDYFYNSKSKRNLPI